MRIPEFVEGAVLLQCTVNPYNEIYEGEEVHRKRNNKVKKEIFVSRPSSPDLTVVSLHVQLVDFTTSHSLVSVSWSVKNIGNSMLSQYSWTDVIGISENRYLDVFGFHGMVGKFNSFDISYQLESTGSYTMSKTVALQKVQTGTYFFYLITDYDNMVYEFGGEENNVKISDAVYIPPIPIAKLNVISLEISQKTLTPGS